MSSFDGETSRASWYDLQFENSLLTPDDTEWLSAVRGESVDEPWLASANEVVAVGSIDLRGKADPATIRNVVTARQNFFGILLGWNNPEHRLHAQYRVAAETTPKIVPLTTFIETQRLLHEKAIDPARLLEWTSLLRVSPRTVKERIANLEKLGINSTEAINYTPHLLAISPTSMDDRVKFLVQNGIPIDQITSAHGAAWLTVSTSVASRAIGLASELGINSRQALSFGIRFKSHQASGAKEAIDELGLDMIRMPKSGSTLLRSNPERLKRNFKLIDRLARVMGWQGNVQQLVEESPFVLNFSKERIMLQALLFERFGNAQMTSKTVGNIAIRPIETQIISLSELRAYNSAKLQAVNVQYSKQERPSVAQRIIRDPNAAQLFGRKIISSYDNYSIKHKRQSKTS